MYKISMTGLSHALDICCPTWCGDGHCIYISIVKSRELFVSGIEIVVVIVRNRRSGGS